MVRSRSTRRSWLLFSSLAYEATLLCLDHPLTSRQAKNLFQEEPGADSNNTQKLEEMDIDDILARAETQQGAHTRSLVSAACLNVSSPPPRADDQGQGGSELLNAFKVADFSKISKTDEEDPEFWNKLVPEHLRHDKEKEKEMVRLKLLSVVV